ncbi:MAG TPA: hypothetical protein VF070_06410 [Streptosporangiaceae bacterium]
MASEEEAKASEEEAKASEEEAKASEEEAKASEEEEKASEEEEKASEEEEKASEWKQRPPSGSKGPGGGSKGLRGGSKGPGVERKGLAELWASVCMRRSITRNLGASRRLGILSMYVRLCPRFARPATWKLRASWRIGRRFPAPFLPESSFLSAKRRPAMPVT